MSKLGNLIIYAIAYFILNKQYNGSTFLVLTISLISNYLEREQLAKVNQRKRKSEMLYQQTQDFW